MKMTKVCPSDEVKVYSNPQAHKWKSKFETDPRIIEFHRTLPDFTSTSLVSLPSLAQELGLGRILYQR